MEQNQGIQAVNTSQPSIIDQIADERDELREENARLKHRMEILIAKERDDANDRIKRLEKAGDDMYDLLNNCDEAYGWRKAKESKP